jgi:ABC-type branched-subunit amino acid transport system substrate-binding protein
MIGARLVCSIYDGWAFCSSAKASAGISLSLEISNFGRINRSGEIMKWQLKVAGPTVLFGVAANAAVAQEKLRVGVIVTLSGPAAVPGHQARDGFALAVKDLGHAIF